tara:strand:+ start:88 stop:516 length:429 start_codon:yes stop_codon:yes gene_type:complete
MEQEYPVPGFDKYTVTEDGKCYSYYGKGGTRRQLKPSTSCKHSRTRLYHYFKLQVPGTRVKKTVNLCRLLLSAKLGRWLEPWEQCRHKDGDPNNNHMSNLLPGCAINNTLDDIEAGTRQTDEANIDIAIARLVALKSQYQSG